MSDGKNTETLRFQPLRRWWLIAGGAILGALVAALVLFSFDPSTHRFYPRCTFHALTGLDCPGCGGLRAAHQLLHGNFVLAFRFNPLLVAGLPLFCFMVLGWMFPRLASLSPWRTVYSPKFVYAIAIAVITFGVLRNVW
jgi:hypothetical protein